MSESHVKRSKTEVCSKDYIISESYDEKVELSDIPPAITIVQRYALRLKVPKEIRAFITRLVHYALEQYYIGHHPNCWIHDVGTYARMDERAARMKYMRLNKPFFLIKQSTNKPHPACHVTCQACVCQFVKGAHPGPTVMFPDHKFVRFRHLAAQQL
jgi:hypothetical protein